MAEYEVKAGECLESIAAKFGLTVEKLRAAQSAELLDARANGSELAIGDKLQMPALELKTHQLATGQTHRITVYRPTVLVGFHLLHRDAHAQPYASCRYELTVPGIAEPWRGVTAPDGYLEQRLPADVEAAEVRVWELGVGIEEQTGEAEAYADPSFDPQARAGEHDGSTLIPIFFGHLPPLDTPQGVQARLINLGFECPFDGDLGTDEAKAAVREFQEFARLEPANGEVDDATRAALGLEHDGAAADEDGDEDASPSPGPS